MTVFRRHRDEYRKGLRSLILHPVPSSHRERIEGRLLRARIAFQVYLLRDGRLNVFLGGEERVEVIRVIGKAQRRNCTPEEGFILGTMLGCDRRIPCRRYLELVSRSTERSRDEAIRVA